MDSWGFQETFKTFWLGSESSKPCELIGLQSFFHLYENIRSGHRASVRHLQTPYGFIGILIVMFKHPMDS